MVDSITDEAQLAQLIEQQDALAVYFASADCGVCQVLWPKVEQLFAERFPRVKVVRVACDREPAIAAQMGVHAVPSLLVFFGGQETIRVARSFTPASLSEQLMRPYQMLFEA